MVLKARRERMKRRLWMGLLRGSKNKLSHFKNDLPIIRTVKRFSNLDGSNKLGLGLKICASGHLCADGPVIVP